MKRVTKISRLRQGLLNLVLFVSVSFSQASWAALDDILEGRWSGVGRVMDSKVQLRSPVDLDFMQRDGQLMVSDLTHLEPQWYPVSISEGVFRATIRQKVSPVRSTEVFLEGRQSSDTLIVTLSKNGMAGKIEDVIRVELQRDISSIAAYKHARINAVGEPVHQYRYKPPVDITGTYDSTTPEAVGMQRAPLEAMVNSILLQTEDSKTESVLILRHGKLVLAEYFWGNEATDAHQTWSVVKSMTGIAAGIAWDKGAFNLDASITSYFPSRKETPWAKENLAVSVRQILSMSSGGFIPRNPLEMTMSDDMVAFMLSQELVHPPGMTYAYDNGLPILAGQLVAETTGQAFDSFVNEHLFAPLGINNVRWTYIADGSPNAAGGFFMTPHDMSRFGQMMLQKGEWGGRQIVSKAWVEASSQKQTAKGDYPYGFYWHLNRGEKRRFEGADGYMAVGALGQLIAVVPEHDLVVVVTSTNTKPWTLLNDFIIPSLNTADVIAQHEKKATL